MNKKLWAIHNWVGLYFGIVIAILSVTGAAVLFKDEIDVALNREVFTVDVPANPQRVSLQPVIDQLKKHYPEYTFRDVILSAPDESWRVNLDYRKIDSDSESRQVFVNPYTGEILGSRDYYKSFAFFLRNIHVRLYESYYGRQIVGLAGVALVVMTITGLLIYGNFTRRQRFGTIRKKNIRTFTADWHKYIGITTLVFNLLIATTGAWLGLQPKLMKWFGTKNPNAVYKSAEIISPEADQALSIDYERVLAASRQAFPDLIPAYIRPSREGERTVEIYGDVPKTAYEPHINRLVLDKQTYETKFVYDIRQQTINDKVYFVQEALHFGSFGGIWLKIVYCLFGLTSGVLSITGFIIYLDRIRKKEPRHVPLETAQAR